ncbi:Integration host factor subunit alpha [compost metagenome]
MVGTVTRADLADAARRVSDISGVEAQSLTDEIIEQICRALERGEDVKLTSFATFKLADKAERMGRNPKTKEEKIIAPRRVISFSAARSMKARVQAGRSKSR